MNDVALIGNALVNKTACSNLPNDSSFSGNFYFVMCFGRAQLAMSHDGTLGALALYMRYYTNDRWYPWRKVETSAI